MRVAQIGSCHSVDFMSRAVTCAIIERAGTSTHLCAILGELNDLIILSCKSRPSAIPALIRGQKPDILILDLDVPGAYTWATVNARAQEPTEVLLVGSTPGAASDAWELGAAEFLRRPFSRQRVELAAQRVASRVRAQRVVRALSTMLNDSGSRGHDAHDRDIIAAHSDENYVEVYFRAGDVLRLRTTFERFLKHRAPFLVRVHRRWAVAPSDTCEIIKVGKRWHLRVSAGLTMPIGRHARHDVVMKIQQGSSKE